MRARSHSGFTLIELSIVLVIIGLLVGGVLVGRDLIQTAQAKSLMGQMEKYELAINAFKLKYSCVPGDCNKATQFGLGSDGDGNGVVGGPGGWMCPTPDWGTTCLMTQAASTPSAPMQLRGRGESQWLWVHLSAAKLISDSITELSAADVNVTSTISLYWPKDALNKGWLSAYTWNSRLYVRTGISATNDFGETIYQRAALTSAQMNYIASKFGYPLLVGYSSTATGYPLSLEAGQKAIPMGVYNATNGNERFMYQLPTVAQPASEFRPCVVSINGADVYNVTGNGDCNLMWEAARM